RVAARSTPPKSSGTPWRPARCADARYAVARALRRRAREKREDPPDQLLVVLEVVAEDPELFEVDDVRRADGLPGAEGREGESLEARAARLGALRDEDEVECGPVASGDEERRAVAPLVFDGDELLDGRAVLDLDEELTVGGARRRRRHAEIRREVLAAEPERERLLAVRVDLVARAAEDRLDEGRGDPTLGLEKIHCSASNGRGFASIWCKSSYYSEEASRRALRARDLVEGCRELDPPARQRAKVRQALHDDDPRAEDHPVHREVLGGEVGQARAVLLETVEADVRSAAGAGVQALPDARDLPEARAAAVRRDLERHVGGGRAERRVVHGDREIDVALHARGSS